jgi:hypothetical protein
LQFLEAYGYKLFEQCPSGDFIPTKFFIIVLSFIEELEVRQRKLVCQSNTILRGGSDRVNGLVLDDLNKMLAESLSLVLVTLSLSLSLSLSFQTVAEGFLCVSLSIIAIFKSYLRKIWWPSASCLALFSGLEMWRTRIYPILSKESLEAQVSVVWLPLSLLQCCRVYVPSCFFFGLLCVKGSI